jgi:transposase-like protein
MPRCPVCDSARIVVVVNPERRAFCTTCGARWVQEGSVQRGVKRSQAAAASPAGSGR